MNHEGLLQNLRLQQPFDKIEARYGLNHTGQKSCIYQVGS